MNAKSILPLTGILAVILVVVAFIVGGETPDVDAPVDEVVTFYTDNDSEQQFAGALLAWAAVAFLFFANFLRRVLRRAEKKEGGLSVLSFGGAIIFAVGLAIFAAISFTLGDVAPDLEPSSVQTLHVMNMDFFFPAAVGVATFYLATGIATIKNGPLPKWLGWLTVVLGVLAITPAGWIAFLAMGPWLIIASIVLLRRADAV